MPKIFELFKDLYLFWYLSDDSRAVLTHPFFFWVKDFPLQIFEFFCITPSQTKLMILIVTITFDQSRIHKLSLKMLIGHVMCIKFFVNLHLRYFCGQVLTIKYFLVRIKENKIKKITTAYPHVNLLSFVFKTFLRKDFLFLLFGQRHVKPLVVAVKLSICKHLFCL